MEGFTVQSIANLRSCDYRLQDVFFDIETHMPMDIIQGHWEGSTNCPATSLKVMPIIPEDTAASQSLLALFVITFINFIETWSLSRGTPITVEDPDPQWLLDVIQGSAAMTTPVLTFTLSEI